MGTTMTEPTTDAGRALLRDVYLAGIHDEPDYWGSTAGEPDGLAAWEARVVDGFLPRLTAIEHEAVRAALTALRERVANLEVEDWWADDEAGRYLNEAVILAAINEAMP